MSSRVRLLKTRTPAKSCGYGRQAVSRAYRSIRSAVRILEPWGIVLVDMARHVAVAHELSGKMKGPAVLDQIGQTFIANWGKR